MVDGTIFHCLNIKNMKQFTPLILVLMILLLNSCAVVGGIFKAGVWVGVLLVLFIIGIIIWLVTRRGGNS
jgi:hypothetical protein